MKKSTILFLFLLTAHFSIAQTFGFVDKKTKEFYIPTNPKATYKIIGYQFANITTVKMVCFSTYTYDVRGNPLKCPLGAYFDTSYMKEGDRIVYLGKVGNFQKMNFIAGDGKKTIFYFSKESFTIK